MFYQKLNVSMQTEIVKALFFSPFVDVILI